MKKNTLGNETKAKLEANRNTKDINQSLKSKNCNHNFLVKVRPALKAEMEVPYKLSWTGAHSRNIPWEIISWKDSLVIK